MPFFPLLDVEQLRGMIVSARKAADLSQAQLAARIGMSQQNYAALELHPERSSFARVHAVLAALGLGVALEKRGDAALAVAQPAVPVSAARVRQGKATRRQSLEKSADAGAASTKAATRKRDKPAEVPANVLKGRPREDW
jgi:HTH-type transcriptional regulator/antitoxin HipB